MDVGLSLGWCHRHRVPSGERLDALESVGQRASIAQQVGGTPVGFELAGPADGHLDEGGGDRREQRREQHP